MATPRIFLLAAASRKRPYVLSDAFPVGYGERFFNGTPLPADWIAPPHEIHGRSYRLADVVSWKEPHPLLSSRAVDVLSVVAPGCAEYRHFTDINGKPYYVLNVLAAGDPTRTGCPPLFRPTPSYMRDVMCSEAVPAAVVAHKLTGFCFRDPAANVTRDLFLGKDTNVYPGVLA